MKIVPNGLTYSQYLSLELELGNRVAAGIDFELTDGAEALWFRHVKGWDF